MEDEIGPRIGKMGDPDAAARMRRCLDQLHEAIADLPSYGYRRVWARIRRRREAAGAAPINVKRVYRVMREHHLLLQRRCAPTPDCRVHTGCVAVAVSN
jgi:putative transposase